MPGETFTSNSTGAQHLCNGGEWVWHLSGTPDGATASLQFKPRAAPDGASFQTLDGGAKTANGVFVFGPMCEGELQQVVAGGGGSLDWDLTIQEADTKTSVFKSKRD